MRALAWHRKSGFTLIELMVVLMIIGIASGGVVLAMGDRRAAQLDQEASRLSALLEQARTQAQLSVTPFRIESMPNGLRIGQWTGQQWQWTNHVYLQEETRIEWLLPPQMSYWVLPTEPLMAAHRMRLHLGQQQRDVGTDGLAAFSPLPAPLAGQ